jgi:FlaA1/EpsC-like NDP-sugar epimerase
LAPIARTLVLVVGDTLLILGAVAAAVSLRLGRSAWEVMTEAEGWVPALIIAATVQACLFQARLYDPAQFANMKELMTRLLNALALSSLILALLYYFYPGLMIARGVFMIAAILTLVVVAGPRVVYGWWSTRRDVSLSPPPA